MHFQSLIYTSCLATAIAVHQHQHVHQHPAREVLQETHTITISLALGTAPAAGAPATSISSSLPSQPSDTGALSPISSGSKCSYWLEDIHHQGVAPFSNNATDYRVFRNVKDYGAKGDGSSDDTKAINLAISDGNRCAPGVCASSTTTPALVYFPPGTYIVSGAIVGYYYTQIVGNPNCLPVIKASPDFQGAWIFDGNKYGADGLGWGSTNVFWRQIRNFVVDMTDIPASKAVSGVHWAVSQATSLQNIVFQMSAARGTQHAGVFIEEGSGGFATDLVFHGGLYGINVGNQQYTMRNLTFYNSVTAIRQIWDWGWTYSGISINNCQIGLNLTDLKSDGSQDVGSVVLYDSEINDTPVGVWTARTRGSTPASGGSLILENVDISNVGVAVQGSRKETILAGSSRPATITAWGQGHAYRGGKGRTDFQANIRGNDRPRAMNRRGKYYVRSKPQYTNYPASKIVSIRDSGAAGDGRTDDTQAINAALLAAAAARKVVFFDSGYYKVTGTIFIPVGSKITGESYPVIMSSGKYFADIDNPKPVVQVGRPGQVGKVEWTDAIVSTQGAQPGAILIQWNVASRGAPSGMWDVHTRIGGFAGSNLQVADCPKTPKSLVTASKLNEQCIAAFQSVHVTQKATGVYMENCWFWVADHDVDDPELTQITVYAGRGLLVESELGNVWLIGTGVEHHVLYEYQLANTKNVMMGQVQTETAYYQPNPDARIPFPAIKSLNDPVIGQGQDGWGLRVVNSNDIFVYGAG
ncbi:hypothetical protein KJ359_008358 [Pestalotiopsis sp. 9143b]|nr:hypothetical protein KJ359_008358 [Pestalotiopsis sp. 9143b]